MYDVEYLRLKVSEILSLGSLGILLAFIVTGFLTVGTLIRSRPYSMRYQNFHFDFLTPKGSNRTNYLLTSIGFLVLMLISIPCFYLGNGMTAAEVFICNAMLMIWGYIVVFVLLADHSSGTGFQKGFIILFLLLINLLIGFNTTIALYQAAIVIILLLMRIAQRKYMRGSRGHKRPDPDKVLMPFMDLKRSYVCFLFMWLMLTAVFPAFNYFIKARQIENIIWAKHEQLQIARTLEAKAWQVKKELQYDHDSLLFDKIDSSVYLLTSPGYGHPDQYPADSYNYRDEGYQFRKILWIYRPVYNDLIAETQPLVYLGSDNTLWNWVERGNELLLRYKSNTPPYFREKSYVNGRYLYLTSTISEMESPFKSELSIILLYLMLLGGILVGFYALIRYFVQRIFGLAYLQQQKTTIKADRECARLYIRSIIESKRTDFNLFIVGAPFSGKRKISEQFTSAFSSQITLSLLKLDDLQPDDKTTGSQILDALLELSGSQAKWDTYTLFIIEYFEYGYNSAALNELKLKLIKTLQDARKPIIILSDIYPGQILSFYEQEFRNNTEKEVGLLHAFMTWRYVFGSFIEIVKGMDADMKGVLKRLDPSGLKYVPNSGERRQIVRELRCGTFLPSHTVALVNASCPDNQLDVDQLIANSGSMAHGYYHSIWNSLASREKYLVYDLAKDGFVNIRNGKALHSLMRKGLVDFEDHPCLFNDSFRNHVMYAIDKEEALEMETTIQKKGAWSFIKVILYLIIIAIAAFLFIGEPTLVEDLGTFLGVLAGIATIMPVVSNLLGGKATESG